MVSVASHDEEESSLLHGLARHGFPVGEEDMRAAKLPIRTRKGGLRHALIDPIDAHLRSFTWVEGNGGYPRRSTKRLRDDGKWKSQTLYLHRELAGLDPADPRFQVHHANHNLLDCRRVNLWICTPEFNARHQRRSTRSMLEELWETPARRLEFWPISDPRRALGYLYMLHVKKHKSFPLEFHFPELYRKLTTPRM